MLSVCLALLAVSGAFGTPCQNPLPGLDKQDRGVDITTLDLVPEDPRSANTGFKSPIVTYTCNQHKHITIGGHTYDVPDQVWHITEDPTGVLTSNVDVMKTSEEMRSTMSTNAGVDVSYKKFAFSATTTFSSAQASLVKRESTTESAVAYFGARTVQLQSVSHLALGTVAQEELSHLPTTYSANPTAYENFVKQYGTHYIKQGKYGGLMLQYMHTASEYSEDKSEQSLEVQAQASFAKLISAHGSHISTQATLDTSFTQHTTSKIQYYGGNANLLSSHGIVNWQPTISAHPWLFSTVLAPISDLVHDAARKNALATAARDHILRSYLTVELPRIIHSLPAATQHEATATSLLHKINTMAHKRPLVASEVAALGNEVNRKFGEIFVAYYYDNDNYRTLNSAHHTFTLDCGPGKIVTHVGSHYDEKDRVYNGGCNYVPGLGVLTDCSWTDWVNGLESSFTFSCPQNGVIKGWIGEPDNHQYIGRRANRRYKFKCCQVQGASVANCAFTNYVNSMEGSFEYKIDNRKYVLKGVSANHRGGLRPDRQFKFQKCELRYA